MSLSIEERAHDIAMRLTDKKFQNQPVATETFTTDYLHNYAIAISTLKSVTKD
ncbi:hypothetical protein [Leuconostoc gelidum]|uniref:hypothetical protein n=1 Tax=Leuconostoc TaxID=1243 RepID=UPI001CC50E77|nr:hypothetical protein [Leuconostoc gelidum]MBZ5986002.1 hypothetical protein [Leuconostoc gelidum subsp. gelidum]